MSVCTVRAARSMPPFVPALPPLPLSLQLHPVVTLSNDVRPRGMRLVIGPKPFVIPDEAFELFLSISAGCPDPDNTESDFITHDSASCESCRLRAAVGRLRRRFEQAFVEETDGELARNIIVTVEREKTYVLHPLLTVRLCDSVAKIDPMTVRPNILAKLLKRFAG